MAEIFLLVLRATVTIILGLLLLHAYTDAVYNQEYDFGVYYIILSCIGVLVVSNT